MSEKKHVVVVGLARSGIAAAAFLARQGGLVTAVDRKLESELPKEALELRALGVRLELGPQSQEQDCTPMGNGSTSRAPMDRGTSWMACRGARSRRFEPAEGRTTR